MADDRDEGPPPQIQNSERGRDRGRRRRRRPAGGGAPSRSQGRQPFGQAADGHLSLPAIAVPFLAVMAAAAFCYFARPIMVPLVTSLTLAFLLAPVVSFLSRWMPRTLAVLLVVGLAAGLLGGAGFLIIQQGGKLVREAPAYLQALKERVGELESWPQLLPEPFAGALADTLPELKDQIGSVNVPAITGQLFAGIGSVLGFLGWASLVALLSIFILLDMPRMQQQLMRLMGPRHELAMKSALDDINVQLRTFLTIKIGISAVLGVVATIGLVLMGVPYAWVWGPLTGVLNIVPYVGGLISSIPPVLMMVIQRDTLAPAIWVAVFLVVLQQIEGNIVTPKLMGGKVQLNVVSVLVASMVWGWLWGALGVLLAIPITAAIKVVCDRIEPLRPIAVLLG